MTEYRENVRGACLTCVFRVSTAGEMWPSGTVCNINNYNSNRSNDRNNSNNNNNSNNRSNDTKNYCNNTNYNNNSKISIGKTITTITIIMRW